MSKLVLKPPPGSRSTVILKPFTPPSDSAIVRPETSQERSILGRVVDTSDGLEWPRVGDLVILAEYDGLDILLEGELYTRVDAKTLKGHILEVAG